MSPTVDIWLIPLLIPHIVKFERFCFFAPSVCGFFLFVYEISWETLNGFAPNSHRRRVWSVARTSLEVKGQGRQGQKQHFSALSAACLQFMFVKTSSVSSFNTEIYHNGCQAVLFGYCHWRAGVFRVVVVYVDLYSALS